MRENRVKRNTHKTKREASMAKQAVHPNGYGRRCYRNFTQFMALVMYDPLWMKTLFGKRAFQVVFNCTKDLPFSHLIPIKYRVPVHDNFGGG